VSDRKRRFKSGSSLRNPVFPQPAYKRVHHHVTAATHDSPARLDVHE
jgi:hypothetical protein